jgi:hypothetical protein
MSINMGMAVSYLNTSADEIVALWRAKRHKLALDLLMGNITISAATRAYIVAVVCDLMDAGERADLMFNMRVRLGAVGAGDGQELVCPGCQQPSNPITWKPMTFEGKTQDYCPGCHDDQAQLDTVRR